jgi:DNA-binding MarR family transcriptional regulator
MPDQLTEHSLTEKFFNLTMLFTLEMQQKDGSPLLYQGQGNILMVLGKEDGLTLKQLTDWLQIAAPSTTEFVNKLVKKGMVTKTRATKDKRKIVVHLTEKGRDSLGQVKQTDISEWRLLTPEQQVQFANLMDLMIAGLEAKYGDQVSKQQLTNLKQQFIKRATN